MARISPPEYFNSYVLRAVEEFKQNQMDVYLAKTACMWAFHMHESFFNGANENLKRELGVKLGNYTKRLREDVEYFETVETVCNVTKHVTTGPPTKLVSAENVQSQENYILLENGGKLLLENGGALLNESSGTYLTVDDEETNLVSALESIIAFWKRELERVS